MASMGNGAARTRDAGGATQAPSNEPRRQAELLAEVHHDLGNTLHAARLQLELLGAAVTSGDGATARERHEHCRTSLAHLDTLLTELEQLLRGRSGAAPDAACAVVPLANETATVFDGEAQRRGIRLQTLGEASVRASIAPDELFRVLANLVGNSVRYAAPDTVVRIACAACDDRVRICIEDRGPGIADEDVHRLFDRRWLASSRLRRGHGLGLAIVRRLVAARGGSISVSSRPNQGSRFVIELPAA